MAPYIPDQQINTGSYIPTTYIFDIARIYELNVNSDEFKDLIAKLAQTLNDTSLVLGTKITGYYIEEEFVTSQLYYNPASTSTLMLRPGFRRSYSTGPVPPGTKTLAHGLAVTDFWKWMQITGALTDTVNLLGYPLNYADAGGATIATYVDATNINIINTSGVTFTDGTVVLEYVKY